MIAFVGAHGTGKTTLLNELKKNRPDLIYFDGFSRGVKRYNNKIKNKLNKSEEQILINDIARMTWKNQVQQKDLVVTRTPFDYSSYSFEIGLVEESFDMFNLMEDIGDVKFFYLPIEFEVEEDGVRPLDKDFQKRIDKDLLAQMNVYKINFVTLSGTVEERLNKLLKNI